MDVLVTGASGFIGSRLAGMLAAGGHSVTAVANRRVVTVPVARVVRGDVTDASSLSALASGGGWDVAYHLAAVTPLERSKRIQRRVNLGGAANLLEAIGGRAKHVVYASGLGVFGGADDPGRVISEGTARDPDTGFARIRLDAERLLEEGCRASSAGFSAAYLGDVYGDGGWFAAQLIGRLRKGTFRMPKSGDYVRSFVHVDDAAGALAAIGEKRLLGESFVVVDSEPAPFRDFVNYAADRIGAKRPGGMPGLVARAVLGGDAARLLTSHTRASNEKLRGVAGIRFPTYREGLDAVLGRADQM